MNTKKFDALLKLHGETQREIAQLLGITQGAVSNKKNGRSEFLQSEIKLIGRHYNLTPDEVDEIFFADEVS